MLLIISLLVCSCQENNKQSGQTSSFPELTGDYLGQTLPDTTAMLFAPGIVSTGMYTRDIAISPDGNEIYFCVSMASFKYTAILFSKRINGTWTSPEVASFATDPEVSNFEPALSADGQKLFFLSARAGGEDIWMVERTEDDWGEPVMVGEPISTDVQEYFPSLTDDGSLYFTRSQPGEASFIYRSRIIEGKYQEPELLPERVNCGTNRFNACISKKEDFIIVPAVGMEDTYGGIDYYIVFRTEDDKWSEPINMGPQVNTDAVHEFSASISPDGMYMFFMSNRIADSLDADWTYEQLLKMHTSSKNGNADIYWISTSIITELREKAVW